MSDVTRYVMIGAGGTGSHFIAPALAFLNSWHGNRNEMWEFLIIDGDNYEEKNQERQMFEPKYIGLNKAQALAETYAHYPVTPVGRFIGQDDLLTIMRDNTVVFLCVDNYSVRSLVEQRAYDLKDVTVINAGNEKDTGSVQLWVRQGGENKTPPISYLHPEIKYLNADDRSFMTCMQVASMPGGEQLIVANMAAAMHMITALWRFHSDAWKNGWTELQFDLSQSSVEYLDWREEPKWELDKRVEISVSAPLENP